ncbi:hypothetical protein K1719_007164 [Acacia pycnantha]|nr:hypothetical protein K1719_007164 [Acacia pycnantha]
MKERIDRVIANAEFRLQFQNSLVLHIEPVGLDHHILVDCEYKYVRTPRMFRFEAVWTEYEEFLSIVRMGCEISDTDWETKGYEGALNFIEQSVNSSDNLLLEKDVTVKERRRVAFQCHGTMAPGPDGYSGCFYHAAWNEVSEEIVEMTEAKRNQALKGGSRTWRLLQNPDALWSRITTGVDGGVEGKKDPGVLYVVMYHLSNYGQVYGRLICHQSVETVEHLLFLCPWAKQYWFVSSLSLRFEERNMCRIDKWIEEWLLAFVGEFGR